MQYKKTGGRSRMVMPLKNIILLGIILGLSAGVVYWTEAEKEIRILCMMFEPGDTLEYVTKTLDTGNLLGYKQEDHKLTVGSIFNLYSSGCLVELSDTETVVSRIYNNHFSLIGLFVWISVLISSGLMVFQVLLAMGYPLGKYAWGGKYEILPGILRFASMVSALLFTGSTLLLLGFTFEFMRIPEAYPIYGLLFLISTFANFNSESVKEKTIGVPIAILLYLSFLMLTIL